MADRVVDVAQQSITAVRDAVRSLDNADADSFISSVTRTFHRRHATGTSRRRRSRRTSNGMSLPLDQRVSRFKSTFKTFKSSRFCLPKRTSLCRLSRLVLSLLSRLGKSARS